MGPPLETVLEERRELLGLRIEEVARIIGIDPARLRTIEAGEEEATFAELDGLSPLVGFDLSAYDPEEEEAPEELPGVWTLLKAEREVLGLEAWPVVLEAAEVARAMRELEAVLERPDRMASIRRSFSPDNRFSPPVWKEGRRLARLVRSHLGIEREPVPSMVDLCRRIGIEVVEALLPEDVSGLCLADDHHGPTVVLNFQGANERPLPRRFTLAHEVCHILFDRNELGRIERLDRYATTHTELGEKPDIERRADAFAIHLLAPEEVVKEGWSHLAEAGHTADRILRELIVTWGVSFTAIANYVSGLGLLPREELEALSTVDTSTPEAFEDSERHPWSGPSLRPVPRVRQGPLAERAVEAHDRGLIGRSKLLELLAISGQQLEHLEETLQRMRARVSRGVSGLA